MDKITFIFKYILFLFKSGNQHSIHSPFVYELYTKAIKPRKQFYIFQSLENLRTELLSSSKIINIKDFGAGSKVSNSNQRTVKSIAKSALKSKQLAQLIFKIIEHLNGKIIIDLGTSFGLTTLYEALATGQQGKVYSFEGCHETAAVALQNFDKLNVSNIKLIEGNIDNTLAQFISKVNKVDCVFFDANHRYEPTMRYFKECLEKAHEESFFIFDDIHWSNEMEKAWKEIVNHPQVTVSIDLFFIGIIFFRKKQPKQHFFLRP